MELKSRTYIPNHSERKKWKSPAINTAG